MKFWSSLAVLSIVLPLNAFATGTEQNSDDQTRNPSPKEYFERLEENPNPETDRKWELLNTRNGKGFKNYLRNLHHGLYAVFTPWFDNPKINKKMSYEQMMRSLHVNSVFGIDGEPYTGNSPNEHGWSQPKEIYAGIFRHDVKLDAKGSRLNDRDHTWHIRVDVKFPNPEDGLSSRFKLLQNAYNADPAEDKVFEYPTGSEEAKKDHNGAPEYFFTAPNREKHFSLDAIRMPGVELPIPVHNKIYKDTVVHQYPTHEMKPLLLEAMKKTVAEIRDLYLTKKQDPETLNRVVDLVAQYIYLGSHAHLFESVNMSLIIAQANYMLSRFDLEGVKSGTLDFRGMYEQFPEFNAEIRKQLAATNPQLKDLKSNFPRSPLISILAHIQDHGDIYFPEGQEIKHPFESKKKIEGIMITAILPTELQLQYMGHLQKTSTQEGEDTPWTDARTFIGTAGQSRALEGIAFRIVSKTGSRRIPYSVHYQVQLNGAEETRECSDGEYCGTRNQANSITSLKVWLVDKPIAEPLTGEEKSSTLASISDRNSPKSLGSLSDSSKFVSDDQSATSSSSSAQ